MKLYGELAPWFHLLTHPADYAEEAAHIQAVAEATVAGPVESLLELGSGGGNNASHLKRRFACTLTDLSEEMLELSRTLNPECEHVQGDMRSLRLGRTFDVVLAHDALDYMTTEHDLRAAIETAAAHLRPGGVAILVPDVTREQFAESTRHGGHDGDDGRNLRYLEWTRDDDPSDSTYEVDFLVALREPGEKTRVVHDLHVCGLFPRETWRRLLADAGLELVDPGVTDPHEGEHALFVARRPMP